MRVFVAGATGAIGRPVVARLLDAGHEVTGIARDEAKAAQLRAQGAAAAEVSLFDRDQLFPALVDHDVVVNLATSIPVGNKAASPTAWRTNNRIRTDGARNLVDAAVAAGVGGFVQEGVTFVYADGGADWIDEQWPLDPGPTLQPVLTAGAEAERFGTHGGTAVVLRFGLFYGDDAMTRRTIEQARAGRPVLLGRPEAYVSRVHLDDAARAVVAALDVPSGIYNVVESQPATHAESAAALAAALGIDEVRFLPSAVVRLAGKRAEPMLRSHRVSSRKLQDASGWSPSYEGPAAGWRAVVAAVGVAGQESGG